MTAGPRPTERHLEVWGRHQRRVLDVAYRMVGSLTEAEDVAQEVFLRLARQDLDEIRDVEGWFVAVTARLCLDHLKSARVARTTYVGPWLPEPLVALPGASPDPADRITLDDSVRLALLAVLERLSPAQRTAFVLHDVFAVPFDEIGPIVGRSPAACKQLARRARRQVREARRYAVERDELERVTDEFLRACRAGDLDALVATLDPDVTGEFDSGGALPGAPTGPITGAHRVARRLRSSFRGQGVEFVAAEVNGEPGAAVLMSGRVVTALTVRVADGRIDHIHAVGNPAKLARVDLHRR